MGLIAFAIMNKPLKRLTVKRADQRLDLIGAGLLATGLLLLALNWGGNAFDWISPT